MIAVDTNILVYAHRPEMPFHLEAVAALGRLARGPGRWAVPWPCIHEFIAVVTNSRIYRTATPIGEAFRAVRALAATNRTEMISEAEGYLDCLEALALPARLQGATVHDARIAAICMQHGIAELWTADRDFSRFPSLAVRNPLFDA